MASSHNIQSRKGMTRSGMLKSLPLLDLRVLNCPNCIGITHKQYDTKH